MASDIELPGEYDAIVLGTGMTESIIAAALSRIGWKVLHLDRNDYYSGDWACFSYDSFQSWINDSQNSKGVVDDEIKSDDNEIKDDETLISLQVSSNSIRSIKKYSFIPESISNENSNIGKISEKPVDDYDTSEIVIQSEKSDEAETSMNKRSGSQENLQPETLIDNETEEIPNISHELDKGINDTSEDDSTNCQVNDSQNCDSSKPVAAEKKWSLELFSKESRKFSIDLAPRLLYCRGEMVELLVSSDVAKYCEFRCISRVITQINGKLENVPCSRSDVFNSKEISMLEKHMLMKLLTNCIQFDQNNENKADLIKITFKEYLSSQKISNNIQHYVFNAISMAENTTTAYDGLISTKMFLQSLGRYGNTAFLWALYGSGELPQCFCRLCAVFGGIYCLKRSAKSLIVNSVNECEGIIDTHGQILRAKHVIMEASYATSDVCPSISENKKLISRVILFTNKSILNDSKQEDLTLFRLPDYDHLISQAILLELSSVSMVCPKDLYVVYISCLCSENAEDDLKPIVDDYFHSEASSLDPSDTKPKVLWCVYFEQYDTSNLDFISNVKGSYVVGGPNFHLDYDRSIQQAKALFKVICPDEEFLPRAPDPEDIIFEDGVNSDEMQNNVIEETDQNDINSVIEESSKTNESEQG